MKKTMCLASMVAFLGCGVEPGGDGDGASESEGRGEALEPGDEVTELVENLRIAGFPEQEIEVRDDGVVWVGGDAVVSLEASREMIGLASGGRQDEADRGGDGRGGEGADEFRQYRTSNLVSPEIRTICIDDGGTFTDVLGRGLDKAIARYNSMNLSFEMLRNPDLTIACDAWITAQLVPGEGGSAGFPSGGFPYDTINIGVDIASDGPAVATHVIVHELGHCIGFRHADYFNRSISCGVGGNEGDAGIGAVHIPGTPIGAVWNGSVMNSCYNGGSTGVLTESDVRSLQELYGNSCGETSSCGGQAPAGCGCDPACIDRGDCCFDGPC